MGYEWNDGHMDDGWGIAMIVTMLGFFVLITIVIVVAIAWSVRSARAGQMVPPVPPPASTPGLGSATASAEQILAERLARGEIDAEEYQSRLDVLNRRGAP
jgi:putative membrane protein